jgi:hypothetical protein
VPRARAAKCAELGKERLTAQEQFTVLNAVNNKAWGALDDETKAQLAAMAKQYEESDLTPQNQSVLLLESPFELTRWRSGTRS